VGPRVSLDAVEKTKISYPYWQLNPGCSAHGPSPYCPSYPDSLTKFSIYEKYVVFVEQRISKCNVWLSIYLLKYFIIYSYLVMSVGW
jgi:hypothetical protein